VANGPASTAATLDYRRRVTADIVAELARAARFKARFFRPRFIQLMLDGLARSEGIRRVMGDLIAGSQSYRGLKWRLAETLEFGLAWKALFPGSQRSQGSQGSQGSREPREPDVTGPSA
jgi:hypothetical protein